ncbi:MAG: fibronectin type III domain-containing protein, partial [Muribaculaceae bacterium]|nr:fibronectin type III domain-containing protein [Muribaculaceae bacterium]
AAGAETPPVELSCASSSAFSKWTTINDSYRGWKFNSNQSAAECYGNAADCDHWLISPAVTLQAGVKYDITYNVRSERATADFTLRFTVGQGTTADAQTIDLLNSTAFNTGTSFKDFSYSFVPETTGEYNFGVWNGSTHSSSIFIKYVKVEAALPFPGAATDVTVTPDANGALGATVAWTWPSVTSKGEELTSVTGAKIYRTNSTWGSATDGNLIATVDFADALPGGQASWHDATLTAAGNYYYFVKPYNENGDSPSSPAASGKTAWIGSDTPAAFTPTATLSDDGLSVSLNWTIAGKNGGTIDPAQISYKIERVGSFSGTTVIETAWQGELPYVDQLPAYDKYIYKVYFITGGTTSTANNATAVVGGPALEAPYSEDFSVSSHGDLWTFVSNITRNWTVSSYKLDFWASKGNDVNAWAITPPFALKAGKAYQLTFKANKQASATEERNLKVALAQEKTLAAMDAAEPILTGIFQVDATTYQAVVTVPADGTYYLGFNINYTAANSNDAYIDDIVLEEIAVAPQAATGLSITPDANGALSAVVAWTNPTLDNTGNALASIDKVELYRGETLVKTFENVAPGSLSSVNETYDEAGTYTYSVVCYLGEYASESATATSPWVGVDTPAAPQNVTLTRNDDGSATLAWSPVNGKFGGYVGSVTYAVTSLVDNQEVASALADTTLQIAAPEVLAIYSYSVAATNVIGTGEAATSNALMLGQGITLPYTPTIDVDALALWSLPANSSGKAWKYDSAKGGLYSGYSSDLWAFTPPLTAQKGKIKLTFAGTAYSSRYPETVEIGLYPVAEIGSEAVRLDTMTITNNFPSDNTFEFEYTLPKAGTYYIGYHLITNDVWGCTIVKSDVEQTLAILPSGPVAMEDFTLTPAAEGALAASLAWTYPTLAENGEQLEAIDSAAIYRNGEQIAILAAAQPGAKGEYADEVSAPGLYGYSIVTYSEGCASQPAATDTLWIGRDTIPAVANAVLAVKDDALEITFDAVTCGKNGGYIPVESVQYVVVDNITGEEIATVAASPVALPLPEAYSLYSYAVYAVVGEEKSEAAVTNAVVCGKFVSLDYENTFATEADMAVMELRPNASGKNWKFVEKDGDHYRFFESVDSAEIVTPPFLAKEGTVTASALARCFGALFPETFVVRLYADGQDEAIATDTIVADGAGFVNYSPVDFAIPAGGIYRVGYTVEKKSIQAYLDGIKIEQTEIIYDEIAKPVENATADAAEQGELRVTVAFDAPVLSVDDVE